MEAKPQRDPAGALVELAAQLREAGTVISPHVGRAPEQPMLGLLASSGERASSAPAEYALVIETVREGYLLHYAEGRVVRGAGPDLSLLAGDYLYALGLERLAALGDLEAVRELSDLISLCAALHSAGLARITAPLWLASVAAIASAPSEAHEAAKGIARAGGEDAGGALWASAAAAAARGGFEGPLAAAAQSVGFATGGPA